MKQELGPFQDIWDAWEEAQEEIRRKTLPHFKRATEVQFEEIESHLAAADRDAAAREAVDVISVALNVMRWLDYTPEEIAEIARARAACRMKGQALDILEKYQRVYGI